MQPRGNKFMRRSIFSVLAICALIALSSRFFPAASATLQGQSKHTMTMPIKHIVFIVKENHSFDNYFGLFPGADGTTTGKAKVNGVVKTVPLGPFQDKPPDYPHGWKQAQTTYDNGAMDLFNIGNCKTTPYPCYQEATSKNLPNYWALASHFLLSDHTFSSLTSSSFPNHLFTVAAASGPDQDDSVIDNPAHSPQYWGCDAPKGTIAPLYNGKRV